MKAVREIVITREEVEIINNFFEACNMHEVEAEDMPDFLEAIADGNREWRGIDIVFKE